MGRFTFWLGLMGLLIGAVFGAIDLEITGALVGGFLGALAGGVCGEVLDLLVAPLFGGKDANKWWKWVLRAGGVVLLLVLIHELYWAVNLTVLTAAHNIGARVTHMVTRSDSTQAVQDALNSKRWQASVFLARPMRWLVVSDVAAEAKQTRDLIDDVVKARTPVDAGLHARGTALASSSESLIDRTLQRTWLLRFVPREMLIPQE